MERRWVCWYGWRRKREREREREAMALALAMAIGMRSEIGWRAENCHAEEYMIIKSRQQKKREKRSDSRKDLGKTKEMNLVSNPKVELRGHVKAKILLAVHRKR